MGWNRVTCRVTWYAVVQSEGVLLVVLICAVVHSAVRDDMMSGWSSHVDPAYIDVLHVLMCFFIDFKMCTNLRERKRINKQIDARVFHSKSGSFHVTEAT